MPGETPAAGREQRGSPATNTSEHRTVTAPGSIASSGIEQSLNEE